MAGRKRQVKRYSFRDGSQFPKDKAQVVGERLESLQGHLGKRGITAGDVVSDAAEDDSPLHGFFEWNDKKAAREHRLEQARLLLRAITVEVDELGTETGKPIRLFMNMRPEGEGEEREYIPTVTVLSDIELRDQLIRSALAEAESWRRRYEHLNELAQVFQAIEKAREKHGRSKGPKRIAA